MKTLKEDVLNVIRNVKPAIDKEDSKLIREWSNHTIHSMSVYQDDMSIGVAVIFYSLAKILEKYSLDPDFRPKWNLAKKKFLRLINDLEFSVEKGDKAFFAKTAQKLTKTLAGIDKNHSKYVRQVIESSKVKKGSSVYEHGISLGRTAEILGITKWELMDYLGVTKEPDKEWNVSESLEQRLGHARKVFRRLS